MTIHIPTTITDQTVNKFKDLYYQSYGIGMSTFIVTRREAPYFTPVFYAHDFELMMVTMEMEDLG